MRTSDRYLAIKNLALIQHQAGVDREVAEIVVAFGRLLVDAGQPLDFDSYPGPNTPLEQNFYSELEVRNPQADSRFLSFLAGYSALMQERGLTPILGIADLAPALGLTADRLNALIRRRRHLYRRISLPKADGRVRLLQSPREPLRSAQRWILDHILSQARPHGAAHGFVRGRSIVSNAAAHVGTTVVLAVDLADFFPSIGFSRVRKGFERLGYPYSVAVALANLCTLGDELPQGAPTSPALSNLVCGKLDRRLAGLAASVGASYTRYADDLTFSSGEASLPSILGCVRRIVAEEGFALRERKTRVQRSGGRQTVTGVVVNEKPNLSRGHVRKLRAAAHRLQTAGPQSIRISSRNPGDHDPVKVLEGHLAFLGMVNPERRNSIHSSKAGSRQPLS